MVVEDRARNAKTKFLASYGIYVPDWLRQLVLLFLPDTLSLPCAISVSYETQV